MSVQTILTYTEIDREAWSRLVQTSRTGTWFQTPDAYDLFASMPELFEPFVVGISNLGFLISASLERSAKAVQISASLERSAKAVQISDFKFLDEIVTEQDVREWYAILEQLYRTKVKTPLWPVEFFLAAHRQGVGQFILIRHEGKIIGGSMVVRKPTPGPSLKGGEMEKAGENGVVYEWYECGLNAEYKEQYPSVMATWAGMLYAHEQGCARYDMMGAGEPGVPYGVRDFKSEFGGQMVEHGRYLCICKPALYKIGCWGVKLLRG